MVKYFASCCATEQLLLAASLTKGFQQPMANLPLFSSFLFLFLWGDYGSSGWYATPQYSAEACIMYWPNAHPRCVCEMSVCANLPAVPARSQQAQGNRPGVVRTYNVAIICYKSAGTHYSSGALILSVMACHSLERTQAGPLCLSER